MRRMIQRILLVTAIFLLVAGPSVLVAQGILRIDEDVILTGNEDTRANGALRADVSLSCPRVTPDKRPALVFVEGPIDKEHLCLAYLQAGVVQKEEIASARYIAVTQLDDALFLVQTSEGPKQAECFAVDLERGIARLLAESSRLHCLRTVPERGKAMLIHCDVGIGEIRLLQLDLTTLDMTLQHVLTRASLGARFNGIGPDMKISPDFRRIAYVARGSGMLHDTTHALDVMDLTTTETHCFAEDVAVRLSSVSSFAFGRPPLEWISNDEIVYQHMPSEPNDSREFNQGPYALKGMYVLNRINITTGEAATLLQGKRRLTLKGGSLRVDPLSKELIYNDMWILDPGDGTLTPRHHPYPTETAFHGCSSASHLHFAYLARSEATGLGVTIYMRLNGKDEPLEAGRGPCWPTRPIGWVE